MLGKTRETDIRTRELRQQILNFLDEVIDENATQSAKLITQPLQQEIEGESLIPTVNDQDFGSHSESKIDYQGLRHLIKLTHLK
jgi:hypothetical protein